MNLRYLKHWLWPRKGFAQITIVRRYKTDNGWIGELYLNGNRIGMTLDNANQYESIRGNLFLRWPDVLTNDCQEWITHEFTSYCFPDLIYVGDSVPETNDKVLPKLIDKLIGIKEIKLTILNRIWQENK